MGFGATFCDVSSQLHHRINTAKTLTLIRQTRSVSNFGVVTVSFIKNYSCRCRVVMQILSIHTCTVTAMHVAALDSE